MDNSLTIARFDPASRDPWVSRLLFFSTAFFVIALYVAICQERLSANSFLWQPDATSFWAAPTRGLPGWVTFFLASVAFAWPSLTYERRRLVTGILVLVTIVGAFGLYGLTKYAQTRVDHGHSAPLVWSMVSGTDTMRVKVVGPSTNPMVADDAGRSVLWVTSSSRPFDGVIWDAQRHTMSTPGADQVASLEWPSSGHIGELDLK